ncbi:MAG: DUF1570 domain-containing protein, partial [Acidobacteria bacterium]|nr:DUF1570 domain-containing protein [Acidobacteriota bacterium]
MRGVLLLLLVFAAFFPRARADDLPGKWLEVRSPNFVVVSDAGEHRARDAAVHFEQIRVLFTRFFPEGIRSSAPPLLVFAVSGEQTMKRFLPEAWQSRDRSRPKGAFRSVPTSSQVVLRADLVGGEDFQTVYHEYFHFLAQTGYQLQLPVWVDEGLAGFWGGTRLTPKETQVGLPNATYLTVLKEGRLLPLPVLAHVDRSSSHYRQGHKASLFYAQSWALIHYILLGEESGEGA